MTQAEKQADARALKRNRLLADILETRADELIETWRNAGTACTREEAWQALRQLDVLTETIHDTIEQLGRSDDDTGGPGDA